MVVEVDDPTHGTMLQPGVNARMSLTPGQRARPSSGHQPAPQLPAIAELDAHTSTTGQPPPQGFLRAALEGVRVLDLCIILAGPTLGRTLAEFGADVIKIDNPTRGSTVARHNDINRGKRSILLDLKSEEGREVFWKLLERCRCGGPELPCGQAGTVGSGLRRSAQA